MPPYLVLDACVLMSGVLRPWLLTLGDLGLLKPVWSDRIGEEWRRNAARIWAIPVDVLDQEWQSMNQRFSRANVSSWVDQAVYPPPPLKHSDPKDWHVITAGHWAKQADPSSPVGVLTLNLKDFRRSELRHLELDLWGPDKLLTTWWLAHAETLASTLQQTIEDLIVTGRRERAPIEDFLRRERLFQFRKLYQQACNS